MVTPRSSVRSRRWPYFCFARCDCRCYCPRFTVNRVNHYFSPVTCATMCQYLRQLQEVRRDVKSSNGQPSRGIFPNQSISPGTQWYHTNGYRRLYLQENALRSSSPTPLLQLFLLLLQSPHGCIKQPSPPVLPRLVARRTRRTA